MTSGAIRKPDNGVDQGLWVFIVLMFLNIALDRWQPDTLAASIASYAFIGYATIWFGLRIRKGYLLRRPHWTRESWLRFSRLAAIPVAAVAVVLYMSSFDSTPPVLGASRSATRIASAVVLTVLLIGGAIGLSVVVGWMTYGEPSRQFTRTRWFQRRGPNVPV